MKTAKEVYKTALEWLGIEESQDQGDESNFLVYPEQLREALQNEEWADDINLHAEIEHGYCSCGLELEHSGSPVETQVGHRFMGEPTSVLMFETPSGFKKQCQICQFEWSLLSTNCEHGSRNEPAHCHYCMQDIVRRANSKGCHGHILEVQKPSIFKQIGEASAPGFVPYMITTVSVLFLKQAASVNLAPSFFLQMPRLYLIVAALGGVFWLLGYYFGEDKARSELLNRRAIGTWYWAAISLVVSIAMNELEYLLNQLLETLGLI